MRDINEILNGNNISLMINELKNRSYAVIPWAEIIKDYEPQLHNIVNDRVGRKDKVHKDGTVDKAARIPVGLEKLLTKRITEFTFAIPVKRVYTTANDTQKQIAQAIEAIYDAAHIDTENIKRGQAYYASCEIFTMWYTVKRQNDLYGFDSPFKLKCKTFSPMDLCVLYPLMDETGDMKAMSFEYERKTSNNSSITFFETFTADRHYKWKSQTGKGDWEQDMDPEEISIEKIPGAYLWRREPVFAGLQMLREDLEYTISRNSDIVAYNASPILKVKGTLQGEENKGETRRIYRVSEGGDVSYVSWAQSVAALEYHVGTLLKYFWMQSQMPDISFENMKSLGNIGYDSRRTLLTDAHLKIGEETGPWLEFLNRECNVIKAFLKQMNARWADEIDKVGVEHVITPFIIEDEQAQLDYHMKANGGKPVESQEESIMYIGKSKNVQETINKINQEAAQEVAQKAAASAAAMENMFSAE